VSRADDEGGWAWHIGGCYYNGAIHRVQIQSDDQCRQMARWYSRCSNNLNNGTRILLYTTLRAIYRHEILRRGKLAAKRL
jgi:hypothetical protein